MTALDTTPIRYWGGPLDGLEAQTIGYPPQDLNGYRMAHCKVGTYVFVWPGYDMRRMKRAPR